VASQATPLIAALRPVVLLNGTGASDHGYPRDALALKADDADTPFMGGSTADTPTTPEFLRVSDADRDHAVNELRSEFVDGRLSHETFVYRMQTALDARNRGQLAKLFTDLPPRRTRLLARIKAALLGAGRGSPDERAQENRPIPASYGVQGPRFGGPGQVSGASQGHANQGHVSSQGHGSKQGHGPGQASGPAPQPAPFFFPPGRGERFTIGRTRDCDLCLTDLSVSRLHAELVRADNGWLLNDLGSHNGTRLNGWLVRETVTVRAGDRVEFGSAIFVIQAEPPPAAVAASDG
jgi:Domain of unknown function (DUF1707)/Inner membrane component of T3SS, cytoplasmic domain